MEETRLTRFTTSSRPIAGSSATSDGRATTREERGAMGDMMMDVMFVWEGGCEGGREGMVWCGVVWCGVKEGGREGGSLIDRSEDK